MKKIFWDFFKLNTDGSIEPKKRIQIGGVLLSPGIKLGRGVAFSGIDLTKYVGHDLEIDEVNDVSIIIGIY